MSKDKIDLDEIVDHLQLHVIPLTDEVSKRYNGARHIYYLSHDQYKILLNDEENVKFKVLWEQHCFNKFPYPEDNVIGLYRNVCFILNDEKANRGRIQQADIRFPRFTDIYGNIEKLSSREVIRYMDLIQKLSNQELRKAYTHGKSGEVLSYGIITNTLLKVTRWVEKVIVKHGKPRWVKVGGK